APPRPPRPPPSPPAAFLPPDELRPPDAFTPPCPPLCALPVPSDSSPELQAPKKRSDEPPRSTQRGKAERSVMVPPLPHSLGAVPTQPPRPAGDSPKAPASKK